MGRGPPVKEIFLKNIFYCFSKRHKEAWHQTKIDLKLAWKIVFWSTWPKSGFFLKMLFIRYEILKIGVSTFEMSIQNPWLLGLMLIFDWYLWRCWYWCLNLPYFYCNLSTGVISQSLSNETTSWVSSWVLCSYWRTSIRRVGKFTMWTLLWWRNIYFTSRQDVFWECVWVDQIAWLRSIRGNNTQDYPRLYHHHHH